MTSSGLVPSTYPRPYGFKELGLRKAKSGQSEDSQTKAWCGTPRSARPSGRVESKGTGVWTLQFGLKSKPVKQSQAPSLPLAPALAGGAENICSEGGEKP